MKKSTQTFLIGLSFILATIFSASFSVSVYGESKLKSYFELKPGDPEALGFKEDQYYKVLGTFMVEYFQLVKNKTGQDFIVNFEWQNNYFGAFAKNESEKKRYSISLWGGMSRAEGMTEEVAYFILCHELGHIMAGDPKQTIPGSDWASSEGQSDFFAAKRCLPHLMKKIPLKKRFSSERVKKICAGNNECETIASIGREFVAFAQKWSYQNYNEVNLSAAPSEVVTEMLRNRYPSDQCRLESVIRGASCLVDKNCARPVCWYTKGDSKIQNELFF